MVNEMHQDFLLSIDEEVSSKISYLDNPQFILSNRPKIISTAIN